MRLTQAKLAYKVGETVDVLVTMERGSHVTFDVQFGNGETLTVTPTDVLVFKHTIRFSHA